MPLGVRATGSSARHTSTSSLAEAPVWKTPIAKNPVCVPSRYSIATGQYSRTLGVYDNRQLFDPSSITIAQVFSEAGYRTCLIGKAHYNGEQFQGYQERPYGDLWGQGHQPDPCRMPGKGESSYGPLLKQAGPSGIPRLLMQTEICAYETVRWLQTHIAQYPGKPFFLSLHYEKPHYPLNPPARYYEYYRNRVKLPPVRKDPFRDLPPSVQQFCRSGRFYESGPDFKPTAELHRKALAAYYGCVEWVDDSIGNVLDALEYLGLAENTIVVYTSDHGEMAAEHGLWQKILFYEASARVPLMIRWPGRIKPSHRHEIVGLIDLFPTLCEAAGVPLPAGRDGVSLFPTLVRGARLRRDGVFSENLFSRPEHGNLGAGCMLRTGRWKYNLYLDGGEELYDLETDPEEWRNLTGSKRHVKTLAALRQRVRAFWKPEEFEQRLCSVPRVRKAKHAFEYSNQYVVGNGIIVNARP